MLFDAYFQMNLLGFKTYMDESEISIFTSTLGNINTYTAYVALVMGVLVVLFTAAKSGIRCMLLGVELANAGILYYWLPLQW